MISDENTRKSVTDIGNTLLSDLIWGSGAAPLYLWIEKRRKVGQRVQAVKVELQAGVWPPAPEVSQERERDEELKTPR